MPADSGREYPSRPLVGVGAVVVSTMGVLMIKRGKPPRMGAWSLPGGAQEVGETVAEAAFREVLEETGVEAVVHGLIDVVDSITRAPDGRIQYHYTLVDVLASAPATALPAAGGDAAHAEWVPFERLASLGLWSETTRIIGMGHTMWQALEKA